MTGAVLVVVVVWTRVADGGRGGVGRQELLVVVVARLWESGSDGGRAATGRIRGRMRGRMQGEVGNMGGRVVGCVGVAARNVYVGLGIVM
ncbi:formin-like protein 5 [Iris pallida]|uniref:Formin-like protein 5 n=1 Tax=Iris pallida TaxID=29817 RepID=A0AAX6H9V2_IRIPA|nr:formin-like protein 5 [Iris pallida]